MQVFTYSFQTIINSFNPFAIYNWECEADLGPTHAENWKAALV